MLSRQSVLCVDNGVGSLAQLAQWWAQCVSQAGLELPVLFFRLDRSAWRAVWPLAVNLQVQEAGQWQGYEWTVQGSIAAWAAVAREIQP